MKKKKVHKLSVFDSEIITLIGIASQVHDYRLSWAINNKLGIKLTKNNEITNNYSKNSIECVRVFSSFSFLNQKTEQQFILISNKSEKGFLVPELKNVDYILKISGSEITEQYVNEIIGKLKEIDIVLIAFNIDYSLHKKINSLVYV